MPRRITAADATPVRVAFVTLDGHLASVVESAARMLHRELPGLTLTYHAATDWNARPDALEACRRAIGEADIIVATMLFMDEHIRAILPALEARRDDCDAMIGCLSAGDVVRQTKLGRFSMNGGQSGPLKLLKKLRGGKQGAGAGARQAKMLKRIPKILRFIPGTAQDVRSYFLTLQYWLAGSDDNIANLVRYLVNGYADGPRRALKGALDAKLPIDYPDVGVYHPGLKTGFAETASDLPRAKAERGRVGLLLMRSYVLAGNTAHYNAVIRAFESRGLSVVPAFASGLDARPAIEAHFLSDGAPTVDAVVSLTGFSLVGGPAYNDARSAEDMLRRLDVPYVAAHAIEFQTLEEWAASDRGLMPVESTIMVAIPELDGATGPLVFGGRSQATDPDARDMSPCDDRIARLAGRVDKLIALRKAAKADRRVAITLFNFPPNAGNVGTAAFLSVFTSLHNVLKALKADGYCVDVPDSVDDLRDRILGGNAAHHGAPANVHVRIPTDDYVRRETWLDQIEDQWGAAPGRQLSDGGSIFILGEQFGNVFVGVQPSPGYEGDPMRLLFEKAFAPTHAFSAFYRYIREEFAADAVLHFGTHGSLEFMPGKQTGLSEACWPDRLIGDLPNVYLYAANNPSEGAIAKRRAAATLVSHLTPSIAKAGLYRDLAGLKESVERWRTLPMTDLAGRDRLEELIQAQAAALDLAEAEPVWNGHAGVQIEQVSQALIELEYALIPHGLHAVGEVPGLEQRVDTLAAMADAHFGTSIPEAVIAATLEGADLPPDTEPEHSETLAQLAAIDRDLTADHEIRALLNALDGRFIPPAPGGDLLRNRDVLPTGRNLHGFDPFRLPSAHAVREGAVQAQILLERHRADHGALPETVALVLWGTDNLKTEGGPIGQALALIGARPRFDAYGRLCGASLISLEELGRPRIDVIMTLSGIFRDLLPLQTRLLAEAALLAARAEEPEHLNFIRKHALAYAAEADCDLDTAALRVFSNADGAYGSNVNHLIDTGSWDEGDEIAETYERRKCFAYAPDGQPTARPDLLKTILADVDLSYQNLESIELGITTIDHYFDTLGGISRAVRRARGADVPVYIGDQTHGDAKVRTLSEQVALETRTRALNPKWYEGMLHHGYEGVRQIEAHITNTMGWSATTGDVSPWVYSKLSETFVLDGEMRERLASLNPTASARLANRLIEAHERKFWSPGEDVLQRLREAGDELEDRLEGIGTEAAA